MCRIPTASVESTYILSADSADVKFQIRPKREYNTAKGYERLLTLRLFASLSENGTNDHSSEPDFDSSRTGSEEPRNAYEFMRRRPQVTDPVLERWNAKIRLANFSSVDTSPICVILLFH